MTVEEMSRAGTNMRCSDCGDTPYAGGMRCLPCFRSRCESKLAEAHKCGSHEAGVTCYRLCRCRCAACRKHVAVAALKRKKKSKVSA